MWVITINLRGLGDLGGLGEPDDLPFFNHHPHCITTVADTTKAQQLLGFNPQITLREGLIKLRDWYLKGGQPLEALLEQEIVYNWKSLTLN